VPNLGGCPATRRGAAARHASSARGNAGATSRPRGVMDDRARPQSSGNARFPAPAPWSSLSPSPRRPADTQGPKAQWSAPTGWFLKNPYDAWPMIAGL
jgi:hypothetical protein